MIRLILDLDGALPELRGQKVRQKDEFILGALPRGTSGGRASVAFICELGDGSHVFAQATLREFHAAAKAIFARYGDELVNLDARLADSDTLCAGCGHRWGVHDANRPPHQCASCTCGAFLE